MQNLSRRAFVARSGMAFAASLVPLRGVYERGRNVTYRSTWSMGTGVNLGIATRDFSGRAVDDAFAALQDIAARLSSHSADSELSRLNRAGSHPSSQSLAGVIAKARTMGDLSEGAFDVTVWPALRDYGFIPGLDLDRLPSERIDYTRVNVSPTEIRLLDGVRVDLGGIAKGYAVDRGVSALRRHGVSSALFDAGGDIVALGRPDESRLWTIGVRDPRNPGRIIASIELEDEAVATSGTYQNQRSNGGCIVNHLINPVTREPATDVLSATVLAQDAMTADALATTACLMDRRTSRMLIDSSRGVEALWLYADGTSYITSGLSRRLRFF